MDELQVEAEAFAAHALQQTAEYQHAKRFKLPEFEDGGEVDWVTTNGYIQLYIGMQERPWFELINDNESCNLGVCDCCGGCPCSPNFKINDYTKAEYFPVDFLEDLQLQAQLKANRLLIRDTERLYHRKDNKQT